MMLLAAAPAACSRDRAAGPDEVTKTEHAAFAPPADSSLTPRQVDRYLRTTLAQLELVQAEAPAVRARLATVRRPPPPAPGAPKGARPKSRQALWGDFVDAAFVRSARKLGYNPAELWYVRHRISAVGGHLMAAELHSSRDQAAALFRQQAEAMRGAPGVTQAQIDAMLQAAAQAERQAAPPASPRLVQNLGALRRARNALDDEAWGRIASVAAGAGLSDLGDVPEAELARRLDELRELHQDAVSNHSPLPGG
ncbi:MAG TPA: hypothetical protein VFR37_02205 [Longimicrobium sp.]|nr:hypothetical protein [Longimicrobium sp.]